MEVAKDSKTQDPGCPVTGLLQEHANFQRRADQDSWGDGWSSWNPHPTVWPVPATLDLYGSIISYNPRYRYTTGISTPISWVTAMLKKTLHVYSCLVIVLIPSNTFQFWIIVIQWSITSRWPHKLGASKQCLPQGCHGIPQIIQN